MKLKLSEGHKIKKIFFRFTGIRFKMSTKFLIRQHCHKNPLQARANTEYDLYEFNYRWRRIRFERCEPIVNNYSIKGLENLPQPGLAMPVSGRHWVN